MSKDYHKPFCLQIHADAQGATAVNLPDTTSRNWQNRPTIDNEVTAANVSPTFISYMAREVLGELETYALKDALDVLGPMGFCIKTDTQPGVTWFEQKFDRCGSPLTGSVHRSLLTSYGRIVPDTLTVDHQGNAVLAFRVLPVLKNPADPQTPPILTISDVAALPTITIVGARWTIGKLTLAGTEITSKVTWRLNFGNDVQARSTDSDLDNTMIDHSTHAPSLEIEGIDSEWVPNAIPLAGKTVAHADTIIYLRKRSGDETDFVPDATPEHIKFTLAGLASPDDLASGGEILRPTQQSVMISGAVDSGGNAPLTIDTASAIT